LIDYRLFKEVEYALHLGTITPRDRQIKDTDEGFKAADKHLRDYITKYTVTLM